VGFVHESLRVLHAQWAEEVGRQQFEAFLDVLRRLQPDQAKRSQPLSSGR
jgi:hypothetical protein